MPPHLRVEIVGAGIVGSATGRAMAEKGHTPIFKDIREEPLERLREKGHEVAWDDEHVDADLTMLCVPTPYDWDEDRYVMDHVYDAMDTYVQHTDVSDRVIAVHSTALPGTTRTLTDRYDIEHAAMVPELLRQRQAFSDALANLDSIIVGTYSNHAAEVITNAYHWKRDYVRCTPTEAELAKFASNWYAATKISFANEVWRVAKALDCNPDDVEKAWQKATPWAEYEEDGLRGGWPYAGACLPKDTNGLARFFEAEGIDAPQLEGTISENESMQDLDDTRDPEVPTGE